MRSSRLFSTVTSAARFTRGESAAGVQSAADRRRKVKTKIFFIREVLLTENSIRTDVHLLELLVVHFVGRTQLGRLTGFHGRHRFGDGGVDLGLLQIATHRTS